MILTLTPCVTKESIRWSEGEVRGSPETADVARLQRVETQPLAGCYPRCDLSPGHQPWIRRTGELCAAHLQGLS